jgi:hypothetical protein
MLITYRHDLPDEPTLWIINWPHSRFVLRRHAGPSPHWDMRFEVGKELYCWSMDRPPSMYPGDPVGLTPQPDQDRRLIRLERNIAIGQNGAGATFIEDFGTTRPIIRSPHALPLREGTIPNRIDIWLEGQILKGGFRLESLGEECQIRKLQDKHALRA